MFNSTSGVQQVENAISATRAEVEPMDLADAVVKSILQCPKEMQSKLASNIVLAGGVSLTPHLITQTEDLVF